MTIRSKPVAGKSRLTAAELAEMREQAARSTQITRGYGDGPVAYGGQINRPIPYQVQIKPKADIPKWSVFGHRELISGSPAWPSSQNMPRMGASQLDGSLLTADYGCGHMLLTNDAVPLKANKWGTARIVTDWAPLLVQGVTGEEPVYGRFCGPKCDTWKFSNQNGGFLVVDKFLRDGIQLYHVWRIQPHPWWWGILQEPLEDQGPVTVQLQTTNLTTHLLSASSIEVEAVCPPFNASTNVYGAGSVCKVEICPITFRYHMTAFVTCPAAES